MTFSYFPGCTLKTRGKQLDIYGRRAFEALGVELQELPEWQCCGAVYPMARDEIATRLSSVRALASARDLGNELVTLCSACHHVIKRVNGDMKNDEVLASRVQNYLKLETPYTGETNVLHYLEVLRDRVGFDELAKKVVKPLTGRKIGAYYGCLLLRPGRVMAMDDVENPQVRRAYGTLCGVLGLLMKQGDAVPADVQALVDERAQARKNKDWKRSDELRDAIHAMGFILEDTKAGQKVRKA